MDLWRVPLETYGHSGRLVGDSHHDGLLNSSDLVVVFQAGEFEDDIASNSVFEEGDWNGDGDFDTSDLVLAFQSGNDENSAALPIKIAETLDRSPLDEITERKKGSSKRTIVASPYMSIWSN